MKCPVYLCQFQTIIHGLLEGAVIHNVPLRVVERCKQLHLLRSWWSHVLRAQRQILMQIVERVWILEVDFEYVSDSTVVWHISEVMSEAFGFHPLKATMGQVLRHSPTV